MKYFRKVSGERIYLSPMTLQDLEIYTKWMNDASITDNLGNSSRLFGIDREKAALEDMIKDGHHFAVVRAEDDTLIGNISLFNVNHISRHATCGLFIGEEENRGKGYGAEALRLLLKYGFETLNLNNVMLNVFSFNHRAIACYKKVGFKVIGERRKACYIRGEYHNDVFMDILKEEFLPI